MERKNLERGILGFLFCLNFFAWAAVLETSQRHFGKVTFFDVGQGDAIFIETSQAHQILIDGGPSGKILEKLSAEMPFYDRSLDLIILTHPEKDHMTGLIEVLKRYRVDYILWTGVKRNTSEYEEWKNALEKEKAPIRIARAGQKVRAAEAVFDILYPLEILEGTELKDSNNTSVVVRLSFGKTSFLFTGDIYQSGEKNLMAKRNDLSSDVLKLAHHGSKTSSSEEFLKRVLPAIAVAQAGKDNPYGHPHQEVLARLISIGSKILRTDEMGDIKIISDGERYSIF